MSARNGVWLRRLARSKWTAMACLLVLGIARAQTQPSGARVERDGVSVEFLRGSEVSDVASDTWRAAVQAARGGEVVLRLSRSEEHRGRRDPGVRRRVRVCDRDADQVLIELPEQRATPGFFRDGQYVHGPESVTPARTEVRVEFEHRGLPVWVSWTVRRDARERHSASEAAVFRSIRCTSGPMLGSVVMRDGVGVPWLRDAAIVERPGRAAEQRAGNIVIAVTRGASARVDGERLLRRVCDRQIDYASRVRGDRTESEVRVPVGARAARVAFSVPTADRASLLWLEDAFFAAITCPP